MVIKIKYLVQTVSDENQLGLHLERETDRCELCACKRLLTCVGVNMLIITYEEKRDNSPKEIEALKICS